MMDAKIRALLLVSAYCEVVRGSATLRLISPPPIVTSVLKLKATTIAVSGVFTLFSFLDIPVYELLLAIHQTDTQRASGDYA
jgi:hypothetical protein